MPIYVFSCSKNHVKEVIRPVAYRNKVRIRCKDCGLYMRRDAARELSRTPLRDLRLDTTNRPLGELLERRSVKEVIVEHVSPEPVRVTNRAQYDKLLRDTHSIEKRD